MLRPYIIDSRRAQHCPWIRVRHDRAHRRQRGNRAVVERRRTAHHDRLGMAALRDVSHKAAQLDFAFVRDGTGVDDGEIGECGIIHHDRTVRVERLAHALGVVLVGFTPECVEVDVHGRTVSPTRTVQTRSLSPKPVRCSRSRPMSRRPRPPENCRPRPDEYPPSVGALHTPNGSCPPRAPRRSGDPGDPISAPNDQLNVSCALATDCTAPQLRHDTVPATDACAPARHCTPAPYIRGRSFSATVMPPTSARSLESERNQPATRRSDVTSNNRLAEPPTPPYATSSRAVVERYEESAKERVATTRVEAVSRCRPRP